MLKTLKNADKQTMAQTLKLRDANVNVREFINACRAANEECIVQDEDDQPVVAVLPAEQYESYQNYVRRREQNFAVLDRIAAKTKDLDPDFIESKIDQAVEEVKAQSQPSAKTT